MPQSLQKGTPSMDSKKYIGMDVHKESISIAVMNGEGKIVMEGVIETKASMILQLIDGLRGDLHVTFEKGTSAAWSRTRWSGAGLIRQFHSLLIANCLRLRICSGDGGQTSICDALVPLMSMAERSEDSS